MCGVGTVPCLHTFAMAVPGHVSILPYWKEDMEQWDDDLVPLLLLFAGHQVMQLSRWSVSCWIEFGQNF